MKISFNQNSMNVNSIEQNFCPVYKNQISKDINQSSQDKVVSSNGAMAIRSSAMAHMTFKAHMTKTEEAVREEEVVEDGVKVVLNFDENDELIKKVYYADDNETVTHVIDYKIDSDIHYKKDGETISYVRDLQNGNFIYFKPDGMMIDHEVDKNGNVILPY